MGKVLPVMTTRRNFLGSFGVFTAASAMGPAMRAFAKVTESLSPLPAYWQPHLAAVAAKVNAHAQTAPFGFWFITDLHIGANRRHSGAALVALNGMTPLKTIVCGGDLVEAFATKYPTDKEGVDFAINAYRSFWIDPVEAVGMDVYTAKGNHDFTIRHDSESDAGFTYSGEEARKFIMGSKACARAVTNTDDPTTCYYYQDFAEAKIRLIVADTTDTVNPKAAFWGVVFGMHDVQLHWLAERAFATIPSGWGAVVAHHIPIACCVASTGDHTRYTPFRELLEAYQNRTTCTLHGKTFDFTHAAGRILLDITGHLHHECQTFRKGILHVSEPCDAAYSDYIMRSRPWCGELPRKTAGTTAEQTFGAVQIDAVRNLVHFTRVGGGQDRTIHLTPRTTTVGKPLVFESKHLKGPLTWGCYDADDRTKKRDPHSKYSVSFVYHNRVATISPDGVLTALVPGETMVLAMDAHLNKEVFPVTVE